MHAAANICDCREPSPLRALSQASLTWEGGMGTAPAVGAPAPAQRQSQMAPCWEAGERRGTSGLVGAGKGTRSTDSEDWALGRRSIPGSHPGSPMRLLGDLGHVSLLS